MGARRRHQLGGSVGGVSKTEDRRIGSLVRQFRDEAGLSQAQLATGMTDEGAEGIYPQTIMKIENGTRTLKYSEASAMARVLGVSTEDFASQSSATSRVDRETRSCIQEIFKASREVDDGISRLLLAHQNLQQMLKSDPRPSPAVVEDAAEALAASHLFKILRNNPLFGTGVAAPGEPYVRAEEPLGISVTRAALTRGYLMQEARIGGVYACPNEHDLLGGPWEEGEAPSEIPCRRCGEIATPVLISNPILVEREDIDLRDVLMDEGR